MRPAEPGSGEFAAIERIRRSLSERAGSPGSDETWIGDDAAVLSAVPGRLLFATDATVGGVHADLELMGVDDLGWRALASAVSDIAAMGGVAKGCVVSVAGPHSTDIDLLYEGIAAASEEHRCPVVGGDLSRADQLVVSVAVVGAVEDGPAPVLRSGARPGDTLWVTGPLGASAAGLRELRNARGATMTAVSAAVAAHLRPRARLNEGIAARLAGATAMIDVSDGFAADLSHLADASNVGFDLDDVPVAPGAELEEALGGGEDYELIFAAPDGAGVERGFEEAGLSPPLSVGTCTASVSRRTLRGQLLSPAGFEHDFDFPDRPSA